MRTDREFNDVLDKCLDRLLKNGETVEGCLRTYPEQSAELGPLLRTALDGRKASAVRPSAEFKARARYQFHQALAESQLKKRPWGWEWRPRWLTAAAIVLLMLLAGGGVGIEIYHSMPGQLLHPVRLTAEGIWLAQTPAGIARAKMHAELTARRVAEIVYVAERSDRSAKIEQVAQRMYFHLATIESLAATEIVVAGTTELGDERLSRFELEIAEAEREGRSAKEQVHMGEVGMVREPGPIVPAGAAGLRLTETAAKEEATRMSFRAALEQQAVGHLATLRGLLPVVSESAQPALLTAIAITEAGYERAIRAVYGK